jgi:hypothetical protein
MGIPLSKATDASEQILGQKVNRTRASSSSEMIQENMSSPRRTQHAFHHDIYKHHVCTHFHSPREEEEEKCSYVASDSKNLSIVISNMFHDQGRRFSRTAIHPVDGRENPSPIESLPPPVYEVRKVHRRGSSIPVRCPRSAPLAEDDGEYLSKLYDLKTWDMYKRITESRRNRRVIYHPTIEEKPVIDEQDILEEEEEEEDPSLESNMIFSFDFD